APLQGFPSEQDVPLVTAVWVQRPVAGSQESVVQALPSSQLVGVPPVQEPPWQVSLPLQGLPSPQPVPLITGVKAQPPVVVLHESLVHGLLSLQTIGVPPAQAPL